MDSSSSDTQILSIIIELLIYLVIAVLFIVPNVIATAILYKKAGRSWWAALIPFYSTFMMARIGQRSLGLAWAVSALSFVNIFMPMGIRSLLGFPLFVFYLIILRGFVMQYDKKTGFWVLYLFLPFIAVFFANSAQYIGPRDNKGNFIGQLPNAPIPQAGPVPTYTPQNQYAPQGTYAPAAGQPFQTSAPVYPQTQQPTVPEQPVQGQAPPSNGPTA